jgi:hypothetical protein
LEIVKEIIRETYDVASETKWSIQVYQFDSDGDGDVYVVSIQFKSDYDDKNHIEALLSGCIGGIARKNLDHALEHFRSNDGAGLVKEDGKYYVRSKMSFFQQFYTFSSLGRTFDQDIAHLREYIEESIDMVQSRTLSIKSSYGTDSIEDYKKMLMITELQDDWHIEYEEKGLAEKENK